MAGEAVIGPRMQQYEIAMDTFRALEHPDSGYKSTLNDKVHAQKKPRSWHTQRSKVTRVAWISASI